MIVYWLMFIFPALMTFVLGERQNRNVATKVGLAFLFIVFVILIGLRTETGADWQTYQDYAKDQYFADFGSSFTGFEPGYNLVTWISAQLGWEVYGATVFCGLVLMYGVIRFAQRQHEPWLTITAAVPYLIIVVGMSYIRQAAAIGFLLLALLNFQSGNRARFITYIILATLFHLSAILVFVLSALVTVRRSPLLFVPLIIGGAPAMYLVTSRGYDQMMTFYVDIEYSSSGTLVRLFMNLVPSIFFIIYRKKFNFSDDMKLLWTLFAGLSVLLFFGYAVSPSSTIVDRLALYLIPIQLLVFGNLPAAVSDDPAGGRIISALSIAYFAAVQFVWLNFAENAFAWLPYKSLLTN